MELLPCPFCGGKATFDHDDNGWYWIVCEKCGTATNSRTHTMEDCHPLLAEQWNRRVSPASVPEGFTMSEPAILPDGSGFGTMTEREATLLGKVERQSAALKLAREALFDMQDSYAAVHGWKDSFVIAATTAIAAIDSLQKGE